MQQQLMQQKQTVETSGKLTSESEFGRSAPRLATINGQNVGGAHSAGVQGKKNISKEELDRWIRAI